MSQGNLENYIQYGLSLEFAVYRHASPRMNPNDLSDPMAFPLVPSSGQNVNFEHMISHYLLGECRMNPIDCGDSMAFPFVSK